MAYLSDDVWKQHVPNIDLLCVQMFGCYLWAHKNIKMFNFVVAI